MEKVYRLNGTRKRKRSKCYKDSKKWRKTVTPSNRTKLGECVDRLAAKGVSKDEMLRILEISYSDEPTVEEGDTQISAVVLERADKIQLDF